MAKKTQAQIEFSAVTKDFDAGVKRMNAQLKTFGNELKLNSTQLKGNADDVGLLQDRQKILQAELEASKTKVNLQEQALAKCKEMLGENSTEYRNLTNSLLQAKNQQAAIENEIKKTEKALADASNETKHAESAFDNLSKEIADQESELSKLTNEYKSVVISQGKGSKEAKELESKINSLNSELQENRAKMNEADKAVDELTESVDTLGEEVKDTSDGFTVMKGAAASLVADGIKSVVSGVVEIGKETVSMANDVDKATNTFIAKTGLSKEAAEDFEDVMMSIYNDNFGESFEDIADAMAIVRNNLGNLDNGTLQKVTEGAIMLRDTFDFDVNETTRTASMLMKQFGIDAETAYSMIATGAQYGLDKNGDLLDTLNEYSVHYKQLGYDVDDMLNMLVNGTNSGTFSVDKLGDAVKEFGIRSKDTAASTTEGFELIGLNADKMREAFAKGGDAAREATDQTLEALFNMDDQVKQNQAGVDLFGTMWEDLGIEGVAALMDLNGEIDTSKDALNELNDVKYDDVGTALEGIKRNLSSGIADTMNDEVMPAVNDFVNETDWQGLGETIGNTFGSMVTGIKDAVTWMKEHKSVVIALAAVVGTLTTAITLYNVVQGIKIAMDAVGATSVWGLVAAHIAQAAAAMAALAPYILIVAAIAAVIAIIVLCVKNWDKIKEKVAEVVQKIKDKVSEMKDKITEVFNKVIGFFKENWQGLLLLILNPFAGAFKLAYDNCEGFREKVDNFIAKIKEFFTSLWEHIVSIFETIKNAISVAIQFIGSIFQAAFNIITLPFRFIWENCKEYVFAAFEWIKEKIGAAIDKIKEIAQKGFELVKEKIINPIINIKDKAVALFTAIKNAIQFKINELKYKVHEIFEAIKEKIITPITNAKNKAVDLFNALKNSIQNRIEILKGKVHLIFESIKEKITSPITNAKNKAVEIFNNIKSSISDKITSLRDKVGTIFNSIKEKITSPIDKAKETVKKGLDSIKGFFDKLKLKFPNIKLPHFSITGKFSFNPPSVPKLSINWNAKGGLFTKPTVMQGFGEAGHEYAIPLNERSVAPLAAMITKLERGNIANAIDAMAGRLEQLIDRKIEVALNVDGHTLATATASYSDEVGGTRYELINRGLAIK